MAYDPNKYTPCLVTADTPIDMRGYAGDRVHVYPVAAGTLTAEYAAASVDDNCVPGEEWLPVECVDACGDESVSPWTHEFTEEDVANKCSVILNCVRDFARLSVDAIVVGTNKSNRPPVNYGCGPTIVE